MDLSKKTVKELKVICKSYNIKKVSKLSKKKLIHSIKYKMNLEKNAIIIQKFIRKNLQYKIEKRKILEKNAIIIQKIVKRKFKFKKRVVKNRGTGAGGSNTNKNGLNYERITDLIQYRDNIVHVKNVKFGKNINDNYDILKIKNKIFYRFMKKGLKHYFHKEFDNKYKKNLEPDESLYNKSENTLYILEKKFQQVSGSVDEKIQTGPCKLFMYSKLYPKIKIKYIYLLSDWFLQDKYELEKEYLDLHNIKIFFPNSINYIQEFTNYIIN